MEIGHSLSQPQIFVDPVTESWSALLNTMLEAIWKGPVEMPGDTHAEAVMDQLIARDNGRTPVLDNCIAYPHVRLQGLSRVAFSLAFFPRGLDHFVSDEADGKDIRVVCLALLPGDNPLVGLRAGAALASMLGDQTVLNSYLEEKDPAVILERLRRMYLTSESPVLAKDIMRPVRIVVTDDTPLRTVTHLMNEHGLDGIAVQNQQGRMVGEINCDRLFVKGIPDFFHRLPDISFIREFDPFEKYFSTETDAVARDLMSTDYVAMPEDATILEIIFALSVRRCVCVHILREGRNIGFVDRITVLNRIINL